MSAEPIMDTPRVSTEVDGDVLIVRLDRAEARNAVDLQLCHELTELFNEIDADPPGAVLLAANGPAFCAGADLKERRGRDAAWVRRRRLASFAAYRAILRCRVPVIAYLHGSVVGSGGEIALCCDFAYASDDVTFRYPEVHRGTVGATQRLQRVIGTRKAKELLYTDAVLGATEAAELGLVQRVFPADEGWRAAVDAARRVASAPAGAMQLTKSAIDAGGELSLDQGLDIELRAIEENLAHDEWKTGIADFATEEKK
ncbi:MAG: enoyl-CoA hydratase/isomerase family protein [Brevibacterium sp.]